MQAVSVRRITGDSDHVIEQTDLAGLQLAIAREAALRKNSLRHAVACDQLHVPLENGVIERLAEFSPHEVRPEALEDVLEGKCSGPFTNRVRDRNLAAQHVSDEHVIRVRPVVHEVDDDGVLRKRRRALLTVLLCRNLVEDVEDGARGRVPETVIREDVEERDDLVDVVPDHLPDSVLRKTMLLRVRRHCGCDVRVGQQCLPDSPFRRELEPVEPRSPLSHGSHRTLVDQSLNEAGRHGREMLRSCARLAKRRSQSEASAPAPNLNNSRLMATSHVAVRTASLGWLAAALSIGCIEIRDSDAEASTPKESAVSDSASRRAETKWLDTVD